MTIFVKMFAKAHFLTKIVQNRQNARKARFLTILPENRQNARKARFLTIFGIVQRVAQRKTRYARPCIAQRTARPLRCRQNSQNARKLAF